MKKRIKIFSLMIALLIIFSLIISTSGCASVTKYSTPITQNILTAYNSENYAGFSKDFDDAMKKELTSDNFAAFISHIKGTLGNYKDGTLKFVSFNMVNGVNTVSYTADFDNKSGQAVDVVFQKINDVTKVTGLWFR
ncbi:MAG: DUF3887 domain-containing protein [Candidatus Humimicrobiaceae bacterium]